MIEPLVSAALALAFLLACDRFGWDPLGAVIRAATIKSPIRVTLADRAVVAFGGLLPRRWALSYEHRRVSRALAEARGEQ